FALWTVIVAITFEALWRDEDRWWLLTDVTAMLTGWQHLWFLSVLLVCYAVAPLTRLIPAWVLPLPLAFASSFLTSDSTWMEYGKETFWYAAFFFAGAAVAPILVLWQRLPPLIPPAMLLFGLAWGYLAVQDQQLRTTLGFSTIILSLVGVLGLTLLSPRLPRSRFLEWVGRGSIVVYLVN